MKYEGIYNTNYSTAAFLDYRGLYSSKGKLAVSFSTRQGKEVPDQVHK